MTDLETQIHLDKFKPRWYQREFMEKIFYGDKKRFIAVYPRRAGKDIMALNIAIRSCIMEPMTCYYIWPSFRQAREALWEAIDASGMPILDYVPKEVATFYQQEMKIKFNHNGSIIRFIGSQDFDRLRGGNPKLIIFTEFAWQSPKAFDVLRPVLAYNKGKAIFISTPWGKNHFYTLINQAQEWPDWDVTHLTVEDTNHMTQEELMLERQQTDEEFFKQEYMCSFDAGVTGSYYGRFVTAMYNEERIGTFPYDPYRPVHFAWDLGVNDMMAIIMFQIVPNSKMVHIIDCYQNKDRGLDHYIQVIEERNYRMGTHILPHDIRQRSLVTGTQLRLDTLLDAGFDIEVVKQSSIMDGIDAGRALLPRVCVDEKKGQDFIKCLTAYRKEWDDQRQIYRDKPVHNWSSHMADAYRYLALHLDELIVEKKAVDIERAYIKAAYGPQTIGPKELQEPFDVY